MTGRRRSLVALVIASGLLVEVTVLARLPLPGGPPPLLLVLIAALGLASGPVPGAAAGFAAGLLADLVPPADHPIGRLALVIGAAGYLAGAAAGEAERSVAAPIGVVAVTTAGAIGLDAALAGLFGDPRVTWFGAARSVLAAAGYAVLLAPFAVPAMAALARRASSRPPAAPMAPGR